MKKYSHLLFTVLFFVVAVTHAQYKEVINERIYASEVPQVVQDAHNTQFMDSFNYEWEKQSASFIDGGDNVYYVVHFKNGGRFGHKAFYNSNGEYLAYLKFVPTYDLPESIQYRVANALEGSYIKSGEVIQLNEPQMFVFRVRINTGGLLSYRYYDKYGNRIDKRNLSPEVFSFI